MDLREIENYVRGMVERRLFRGKDSVGASEELKVVAEIDVREAGSGGTVHATRDAIVTPAAEDLARAWGVRIQRGSRGAIRRIALGSDHAGYEMKKEIAKILSKIEDIEVFDLGAHGTQSVDYPDFAQAVAESVADGRADLGIMVDGAGIGSAIAANKIPGIRAAMCYDAATARNSREHNFANVLTLGGRMIDAARAEEIVKSFLDTPTGEERHAARVRKITAIEKKYSK
jgi:ribose 5-phosphate isomerase B